MTTLIPILFVLGLILKLVELFGPGIIIALIVVVVCFVVLCKSAKKMDTNSPMDRLSEFLKGNKTDKTSNSKYTGNGFQNIETVDIINTEMTYRIEEREEFDIVMTNFLTEQDGWQHYETKTVQYEVPDGYEYTFSIYYLDGSHEICTYHESSPIAQRLIEISEKSSLQQNVVDDFNRVAEILGNTDVLFSGVNAYEEAEDNFEKMRELYSLNSASGEPELIKACEVKLTSLLTATEKERVEAICQLMYFILCDEASDMDLIDYKYDKWCDFTQKHSDGVDAFSIIAHGEDIDNSIILEYDNYRVQKGYRKICLLTLGTNKSTLTLDTVIVWDMKMLITAYMKAFKKIIAISEEKNKPIELPYEDFVVIDIETTGTNFDYKSPDMDEILSVSIIDAEGNVLLDKLCGTERKKSWYEAQRVNGISPRDVKGLPTFNDILYDVLKILSAHKIVIGYNVSFEQGFIQSYIKRRKPIDLVNYRINWGTYSDPMNMYMNYVGSNKWIKLEAAANSFGYTFNAHNSLEDAKATRFLYNKLREEQIKKWK